MTTLVVKQRERIVSDRKVTVTASIELVAASDLSANDIEERVSVAEQIAAGMQKIEISDALTGEIDTVPVERLMNTFPDTNWSETYLEATSLITSHKDNKPPLTLDEVRAERRRNGLKD